MGEEEPSKQSSRQRQTERGVFCFALARRRLRPFRLSSPLPFLPPSLPPSPSLGLEETPGEEIADEKLACK